MTDTGFPVMPLDTQAKIDAWLRAAESTCKGPSAPLYPRDGQLWWDTTTGTIKLFSVGATSAKWIVAVPDVSLVNGGLVPASQPHVATFYAGDLNASGTIQLGIVGASGYDCTITGATFMSAVATTGSNGGNNYSFQLRADNVNVSDPLSTASAELGVGRTEIFSGASDVAEGDRILTLVVTKTGTPTALSAARAQVVVTYTLAVTPP